MTRISKGRAWRELTRALDVTFRTFRDVGLDASSADDVIWHFCQSHAHYLLTSNRNEDAEDSLEATLRREGTFSSLPIFTIALPDRVYHSAAFLERVVEKLLDYYSTLTAFAAPADSICRDG